MDQSISLIGGASIVFAMALVFAFINGVRNASLVVATVVSTRAATPMRAFLLCALAEVAGLLCFGSAIVAMLTGKMFGFFSQGTAAQVTAVLGTGLGASILWGGFCYWRALPISSNHTLLAALAGSSSAAWGISNIWNSTLLRVLIILLVTPLAAFVLSSLLTWIFRFVGEWLTPRAVEAAQKMHVAATLLVAAADGSNDGQVAISVALLALTAGVGHVTAGGAVAVPLWLVLIIGGCMSLGVLMGGRRIAKKMGMSFYRVEVLQGLGSQTSAASLILTCLSLGFPASLSQVVTGSILGAGAAKNARDVRWALATDVVLSWFFTVPVVAALAALGYVALMWVNVS